jgi:hypothetical protein
MDYVCPQFIQNRNQVLRLQFGTQWYHDSSGFQDPIVADHELQAVFEKQNNAPAPKSP